MSKKKAKKKTVVKEVITDIVSERFMEDGDEMVKKIYMNKDKVIKEEIVKD